MRIVIIIPTYNESDNIGLLIEALERQFDSMTHKMHILVVDDESPDGTGDVVWAKRERYTNVHLLSGRKEGLGAAYVRGMSHALDVLKADAVFEMDADFSHKPEDVPRMVAALENGSDFVIGSRYIKGGSIPKEWGLLRRLISMFGNVVARFIAGLYRVKDCTAGFRAIRASVVGEMDLKSLGVQGYAFQIALLHRALANGAVVTEVPVDFIDRTRGNSKLGFPDIIEFIVNAWWIRLQDSKTFLTFGAVGALGVVVNIGIFTLLLRAEVPKYLASPVAIELSIIWNFFLNNYWTFRSRRTDSSTRVRGLRFNLVSFVALVVSYSTFIALSLLLPKVRPELHQLAAIIPATLVNYFLNSYWTFKDRPVSTGMQR